MTNIDQYSGRILAEDRAWFSRHSSAVVRYRPIHPGELVQLKIHRISASTFRPSWSDSSAQLEQIAVIDLTRLLQYLRSSNRPEGTIRIRILTIKASRKNIQARLEKELIKAVCAELHILLDQSTDQSTGLHRAA